MHHDAKLGLGVTHRVNDAVFADAEPISSSFECSERLAILGQNSAALYGVDTAALAPLVERIGPLVDDIHGDTPLQEVPEDR